jgi:hypothetical protein
MSAARGDFKGSVPTAAAMCVAVARGIEGRVANHGGHAYSWHHYMPRYKVISYNSIISMQIGVGTWWRLRVIQSLSSTPSEYDMIVPQGPLTWLSAGFKCSF